MRTDNNELIAPIVLKYKNPTGLFDQLPETLRYRKHATTNLAKLASTFGYREVTMPSIEPRSLYTDAFGESLATPLIPIASPDQEDFVLRAHPRLGILRSYKESGFYTWPPPVRVFYEAHTLHGGLSGIEQHNYFCLDCLGIKDVTTTGTLMVMLRKVAHEFHIKNPKVHIYSNGCTECRPAYETSFNAFLNEHKAELCPVCSNAPTLKSIAQCEIDSAATWLDQSPSILDLLCATCHGQLANTLEICDELEIEYDVDPLLFVTQPEAEQTTFAIKVGQEALPAITGFYYNRIATRIAEEPLSAVGITVDLELLSRYLENQHVSLPETDGVQVFVAQLGSQAKSKCIPLLQQLYGAGLSAVTACESESITQQLQVAERLRARITLIMGQKEAINGHVIMRDMASGLQDNIYLEELLPVIQERLAISY